MRHISGFQLRAAALCVALAAAGGAVPLSGNSDSFTECNARCAGLDGEMKARCINTCVRTKKKNAPVGDREVKTKMRDCEERCASYTGVDRIRCIRICLDLKNEQRSIKKEKERAAVAEDSPNPCESRCGILTGVLKERCMARCQKESKFDRDKIRSK